MAKFTQAFKDTFNRVKERVSNSSKKKNTKYGSEEIHQTTRETTSHTQERMATISQQIKTQQMKSNQAKANLRQSSSKSKLPSSTEQKKSTTQQSKNSSSTSKPKSQKVSKKSTPKSTSSASSQITYPSGKIVNSQVLSDVEKGYLELAGFKNYKDTFIGLNTSSKRSQVAKQVATQTITLSTILKKLELLQVKGIGENVAFALSQVGVGSLQKLSDADSEKLSKKIQSFSKAHEDIDIKVSKKQLEKYIKESKSTPSVFN
jgi:hypothetical protein